MSCNETNKTLLNYGQIHSATIRSAFYKDAEDDSDAEIERIFSREHGWPPALIGAVKALRNSGVNLFTPPVPEPYEDGPLNEYFAESDERDRLACISATGYTPEEISRMTKYELVRI